MNDEQTSNQAERQQRHPLSRKVTLIICAVILLLAVGAATFIFVTEPTSKQQEPQQNEGVLVEVEPAERGDFEPVIRVLGAVQPARRVTLSPRVGGQIVELSPEFMPGGLVSEGEVLARVDPVDYQNIVAQRRSQLEQALADLHIEQGRQEVAEEEYELLDQTLPPANRALVLRKPQLESAQAQVQSARAALRQAKTNLARTRVKAPFDAQVLYRNANVGSQVAAGESLAELVGIDEYWVIAEVPLTKLQQIKTPDGAGKTGSKVRLRNRAVWPKGVYREGRVQRVIGALDEQTRLARVLVSVQDPLALNAPDEQPRLMIDAIVAAEITGATLADVFRINRDFVRDGDTVWIMDDGKLAIKKVEIVFEDAKYAYISAGLQPTDRIVLSNLTTVSEGIKLRVDKNKPQQQAANKPQESGQ